MGLKQYVSQRWRDWQVYRSLHADPVTLTILCLYGFTIQFRPCDPFIPGYLQDPEGKNLTSEEANALVLPYSTYSYLLTVLPVMLLVDVARYRSFIFMHSLSYVIGYVILLGGTTLGALQLSQTVFGIGKACEVGYFTYGYVSLESIPFIKNTGFIWGYYLLGICASYTLGQIVMSASDYSNSGIMSLIIIAICFSFISLLFVYMLPAILTPYEADHIIMHSHTGNTLSQNRENGLATSDWVGGYGSTLQNDSSVDMTNQVVNSDNSDSVTNVAAVETDFTEIHSTIQGLQRGETSDRTNDASQPAVLPLPDDFSSGRTVNHQSESPSSARDEFTCRNKCTRFYDGNCKPIVNDFKVCYDSGFVFRWITWWTMFTCVYTQMTRYSGFLWEDILQDSGQEAYDLSLGVVQALAALTGAISAFTTILWKWQWDVLGDILKATMTPVSAILMILTSQLSSIALAYVTYVVVYGSYHLLLVVASFQIALHLRIERYGMVFSFNNFLAGSLNLLFMLAFVTSSPNGERARIQFLLNGVFLLLLAVGVIGKLIKTVWTEGAGSIVDKMREPQYGGLSSGHI